MNTNLKTLWYIITALSGLLSSCANEGPKVDPKTEFLAVREVPQDEDHPILALFSVDNSKAWEQVNSPLNVSFNDLYFYDTEYGWAVAFDDIAATRDGGISWERQEVNDYIIPLSVHFTDMTHGWAVGNEGTFIRTTDGGENWINEKTTNMKLYSSVQFITRDVGYVADSDGNVLKTIDGGTNWTAYQTSSVFPLNDLHFVDEKTGWAVGYVHMFRTTDGGQTWVPLVPGQDLSANEPDFTDVQFIDNQIGWIAGWYFTSDTKHFVLLKTTDGGDTWVTQLDMEFYSIEDIFFLDENQGRILLSENQRGYGFVLRTDDGGESWSLDDVFTKFPMYAIHFADAQHGWVVGEDGLILRFSGGD